MFTVILYVLAIGGLALSAWKDKQKTKKALIKAWRAVEKILPQFLSILLLTSLALSVFDQETISAVLGTESGVLGVLTASLIGSVTLIPGFVAFPLAAALLKGGAGYMQIAVFVSTLMMVGVITLPVEIKTFGKRVAVIRNVAAYVFSVIAAIVIGVVM